MNKNEFLDSMPCSSYEVIMFRFQNESLNHFLYFRLFNQDIRVSSFGKKEALN